ncbi:hypothetical protein AB0A69_15885 [Streptomyces sp. NPDC045431]|uniref:hypothetical protein n=1 Tax=Streptomyces sp. NPDC045431 TaxID=3155613 RepID=UPI0034079BC2
MTRLMSDRESACASRERPARSSSPGALLIVESVAARWGVEELTVGKTVWAELVSAPEG